MPSVVVVGAQWGDEGKGKLVDVFTEGADWAVRFQGGNNAGHTLVVNGHKTKLQLIPCGILRPKTRCLIGAGVVANPRVVISEIAMLKEAGVPVTPERLVIDRDCNLVLDYHPILDLAREAVRGEGKIGTTGRGIGPAFEDRAQRSGVRFADLMNLSELRPRLEQIVHERNLFLTHVLKSDSRIDITAVWETILLAERELLPFVGNGSLLLNQAADQGQRIIFEGAQATLLDQTFGTVPFVTSCSTLAGSASCYAGIGPQRLNYILGVAKAYATRVGSGPFPTELLDVIGERIREKGGEFGTVTGRPRRCGWFDAVVLQRAARLNGIDGLALTKLDVLSGIPKIRVGTQYRLAGKVLDDVPALASDLAKVEVQYEELEGWEDLPAATRDWNKMPGAVSRYLSAIEDFTRCKIAMVSFSAERDATVFTPHGRYLDNFRRGLAASAEGGTPR